jgi:hypothetical protein
LRNTAWAFTVDRRAANLAVFGCGLHPLAERRQQQRSPSWSSVQGCRRRCQPVPARGRPAHCRDQQRSRPAEEAPLPAADRARVRTAVARELSGPSMAEEPMDARELAGQIAKDSRPRTQTVAGHDLTFSPVKSVSTL